jgi:hypothetical protein
MRETEVTAAVMALEAICGRRWAVWLSDTGIWWAARIGRLTTEQTSSGCVPFLKADSPGELAASIRDQDRADSLSPARSPALENGTKPEGMT